MNEEDTEVIIYLLGDVIQHVFLKPEITEKGKDLSYVAFRQITGAAILKEMIYNAVSGPSSKITVSPDYTGFDDKHGPKLISILDHFPHKSREKEDGNKVLRVKVNYSVEKVLLDDETSSNPLESMQNLFDKLKVSSSNKNIFYHLR